MLNVYWNYIWKQYIWLNNSSVCFTFCLNSKNITPLVLQELCLLSIEISIRNKNFTKNCFPLIRFFYHKHLCIKEHYYNKICTVAINLTGLKVFLKLLQLISFLLKMVMLPCILKGTLILKRLTNRYLWKLKFFINWDWL